jgi:hypothetical protein
MVRLPSSSIIHLQVFGSRAISCISRQNRHIACSLVVGTKNMHVQTVLARQQLRGFHISLFCIEQVEAEIIYVADDGGRCVSQTLVFYHINMWTHSILHHAADRPSSRFCYTCISEISVHLTFRELQTNSLCHNSWSKELASFQTSMYRIQFCVPDFWYIEQASFLLSRHYGSVHQCNRLW